jgi:hypothetical protein
MCKLPAFDLPLLQLFICGPWRAVLLPKRYPVNWLLTWETVTFDLTSSGTAEPNYSDIALAVLSTADHVVFVSRCTARCLELGIVGPVQTIAPAAQTSYRPQRIAQSPRWLEEAN